jgi:hypothetical protein
VSTHSACFQRKGESQLIERNRAENGTIWRKKKEKRLDPVLPEIGF